MKTLISFALCALCALFATAALGAEPAPPTIIELTQVSCQFLESEQGINHGFRSKSIKDCEAINTKTGAARLRAAQPLRLKPGRYIFRVTNRDVPYELGFWLRGAGIAGRVALPGVSGGGLVTGRTQDYAVDLKPGEYLYSCPLNTTPDYQLLVK